MSPTNNSNNKTTRTAANAEPLVDSRSQSMSPKSSTPVVIEVEKSNKKNRSATLSKSRSMSFEARRKNMARARQAYATGDVEAMKAEHALQAPEKHGGTGSEYIKSVVFGGLDGIVTTFSVVTAAAGSGQGWRVVLVFGFANALADAWSMGFGECISGMAERDAAIVERKREQWEVEHNIQGEIDEMIEIYEDKGFPPEDARAMVKIVSKDPERFVDVMMVDELGILIDLDDKWGPVKQGVVMFFSFIFFGAFPLMAYLGGKGQGTDSVFGIACAVTILGLMILGGAKGRLSGQSMPKTAAKMIASGIVSGGVSFGVGVLVNFAVTGDAFDAPMK